MFTLIAFKGNMRTRKIMNKLYRAKVIAAL